jgi:hypothetical protein
VRTWKHLNWETVIDYLVYRHVCMDHSGMMSCKNEGVCYDMLVARETVGLQPI